MKLAVVLKYKNAPTEAYYNNDYMYVALDSQSGGYPTRANIWNAHRWDNVEDALKYQRSFDKEIESVPTIIQISEV